jgi:DNA-binding Xre family transcriptional regulator
MNRVQFIESEGGERLALLSEKDFKALTQAEEELADIGTYDAAKAALASGEEFMIPAEYVNRILDGENSIRVFRQFCGLTAKALADGAGISAAYLSEIETGKKEGRVSTLKAIADQLNVGLDDLV